MLISRMNNYKNIKYIEDSFLLKNNNDYIKYTWLKIDLNMINMELLDLEIEKTYDKTLSKNHLIFFPKSNTNDKYIKLSDEGPRISLSLIEHDNFKILNNTTIEIDDLNNGLKIINNFGNFNQSYLEYYVSSYKVNDVVIEIIKLPGFNELLNIMGKKSECEKMIEKFNLEIDKSFSGDIYDIYKKYDIDLSNSVNIKFNNNELINNIKHKIEKELELETDSETDSETETESNN